MTKEPIIIDDVDVAECFHFDKGYKHDKTYCMCDGNMSNLCQENPNCYYKQLKRKEQECNLILENLKNNFFSLTCVGKKVSFAYKGYDIDKLIADNDQLKAENDELKEIQLGFSQGENLYNLYRYKQTLQEIKDYCNKYPQNSIGFKKQILQKCEVIKDEV